MGGIPYQYEFVIHPCPHIGQQIVQQIAASENRIGHALGPYQRRFVHDIQCILVFVRGNGKPADAVFHGRLSVNALVYSISLLPGITRKHFRRTPRGSHQAESPSVRFKCPYYGNHCRCLARPGITVHHENIVVVTCNISGQHAEQPVLAFSRGKLQIGQKLSVQIITYAHSRLFSRKNT